ncbi:MAG: acyl-CoA dehydrogenase family protein [Acidobacteriota bacterium]|jgi:acyl-CoA dehydrogenase family member 9
MAEKKNDSVGIMAQVFAGGLDNNLIFPYPKMDPDETEVVDLISGSFKDYASKNIDAAKFDEEHEIPKKILDDLFEMGMMGLSIPEEYGGGGLSMSGYCKVMEALTPHDVSTAVTIGAHQSIGMKAILLYGTEEQKKRFLPKLATGERIAAYALTEPGAGSDAGSIATRAEYDEEKKTFKLNGSKLWITNGGIANLITVFAKEKFGDKDAITVFIVEGDDIPGLTRGKPENKMGIRASNTTELHFENVEVPEENVLGERGKGFRVALEILDYGRLSLGAGCVGAMKGILNLAIVHAKNREQFGAPISDLEMIQGKISRMMVDTWVSESMVYMAASLVDRGIEDFSIESAICKAYCSEAAWDTINSAMQIVGGVSYMREYPYERMMRDARINLIFEGTNEIQRLYTSLAGLKRPGDVLKGFKKAGAMAGMVDYSLYAVKKRFTKSHLEGVDPTLSWFQDRVEAWVKEFALTVDRVLVKYGKKVISKGFLQERIADAAIQLFGMIATLSRLDTLVKDKGSEAAAHEFAMTKSFYGRAWRLVRQELDMVEDNGDKTLVKVARRAIEDEGYRVLK